MTSGSGVLVSASVRIGESTEINYHVFDRGLVEFSIGDGEFDLLATERGLRNLVDRAGEPSVRSRARSPVTTRVARRRDPAVARPLRRRPIVRSAG